MKFWNNWKKKNAELEKHHDILIDKCQFINTRLAMVNDELELKQKQSMKLSADVESLYVEKGRLESTLKAAGKWV